MSETTPKSIDVLANIDTSAHPQHVRLEENFQGDNGGITATEAGVPYRYFYFDYKATQNPDDKEHPNFRMSSTLQMDPDQIVGNDWSLVKITVSRESMRRNVTIEASVKNGTTVTIRDVDYPNHSSTTMSVKEDQTSALYRLAQAEEDIVVTEPEVSVEDAQVVSGTFNNLMDTVQQMINRGFENGKPD
jgi:hypothetical protein